MDQKEMIEDFIKMLDNDMENGVGHVNVRFDDASKTLKKVAVKGCFSTPTLHQGLDDFAAAEQPFIDKP